MRKQWEKRGANGRKRKAAFRFSVPLYLVSKTNRRDGFHGLFRRLERLIQTIPIPCKGLSEHVIETIRIARRDYLNDSKVPPHASAAHNYQLSIINYQLFKMSQKYVNAISLLKNVVFEETHDNSMNAEQEDDAPTPNQGGGGDAPGEGD